MFINCILKILILDPDIIGGNNVSIITTTSEYDKPVQDMPISSVCERFQSQNEIFSPNYPQPYPNNTECIRKLEGIRI